MQQRPRVMPEQQSRDLAASPGYPWISQAAADSEQCAETEAGRGKLTEAVQRVADLCHRARRGIETGSAAEKEQSFAVHQDCGSWRSTSDSMTGAANQNPKNTTAFSSPTEPAPGATLRAPLRNAGKLDRWARQERRLVACRPDAQALTTAIPARGAPRV